MSDPGYSNQPPESGYPSEQPEETPTATAEKASGQLLKLVGKVIDTGVGPLTGSITWAEDRLARVQGARYEPNADPTRSQASTSATTSRRRSRG